jgi:hypothetical protein
VVVEYFLMQFQHLVEIKDEFSDLGTMAVKEIKKKR